MTSQTPQPNLIPEEWLSAYLDNELDADQRQLVETAVSQNPQLAQLLYDLQATRRLVQQLPSFPSNATLRHPSSSADRKVLDLDDGLQEQPNKRNNNQSSASSLSDSNDNQMTERLREDRGFSDSDSDASVFRIGSWQLSHWRALALAASVVGVALVGSMAWYGVFGGGSSSVAYAPDAPGATTQSAARNERSLMDSEGGPSAADNLRPMASANLAHDQYGAGQANLLEEGFASSSGSAPSIAAPSQAAVTDTFTYTQPQPSQFEPLVQPSASGGAAAAMPNTSTTPSSDTKDFARGINPPNLAAPAQEPSTAGALSQGLPESTLAKNDPAGAMGSTGLSMSDKFPGEAQVDAKGSIADSQQPSIFGNGSLNLTPGAPSPSNVRSELPEPKFGEQAQQMMQKAEPSLALPPKIANASENSEPSAATGENGPTSSARGGLGGIQPSDNVPGAGGFGSPSPPSMRLGGGGVAGMGGGRNVEPANLLPPPSAFNDPRKAESKMDGSNEQMKNSKSNLSIENRTDNLDAKLSLKKTTLVTKALIFRSSAWTDDEMLAQLEANALLRHVKSLREKTIEQQSASLPQAQVAPVTLAIVSLEFEQRQKLFQLAQQIGLNANIQENEQTTYAIFLSRKELSQLQQALNDATNSSIKFTMITSSSDQSSEKCVLILNPK